MKQRRQKNNLLKEQEPIVPAPRKEGADMKSLDIQGKLMAEPSSHKKVEQIDYGGGGANGAKKPFTYRETGRVFGLIVVVLAMITFSFFLPKGLAAQDSTKTPGPTTPSASELAKQTQNPISSLISFPIEANWDMGVGEREATSTLVNIQPVIPFAVSKKTNVVMRVIMPLMSQPPSTADGSRISGMGDIIFSLFFTPGKAGKVIWGVGPVLSLPSATDAKLGSEKFGVGPTAVVLTQPGNWSFGLLVNQVWSVSGATDREDVNRTYLQPFMHYNLGHGLSLGASAEATGNWSAKTDKWSSPLLFNVSKVTTLGKRPVNFKIASGPTFGPEEGPNWRFRFVANFLFPK